MRWFVLFIFASTIRLAQLGKKWRDFKLLGSAAGFAFQVGYGRTGAPLQVVAEISTRASMWVGEPCSRDSALTTLSWYCSALNASNLKHACLRT
jgi:hypothetical protein